MLHLLSIGQMRRLYAVLKKFQFGETDVFFDIQLDLSILLKITVQYAH